MQKIRGPSRLSFHCFELSPVWQKARDQIAADVAVRRFDAEQTSDNRAVETRFAAILPFAKAEFEKDFRRDPNNNEELRSESAWRQIVGDFRAVLDKPAVELVLQIDDAAIRDSTNPADRTLAYANLRDLILEHADLLVAVSDDVDGGTGGTVDAIRRAVRIGIPTIKISTAKQKIFLMRSAQPDAVDQTPVEDEEFKRVSDPSDQLVLPEKVATALAGFLEPPRLTAAETHAHDRTTRARFEQYFDEKFEPVWFGRIFRAFRDAVTAWPKSSRKNRVRLATAAFFRTLRNYRVESPAEKLTTSWPTSESGTLFTDERNNKRLQRIHATRLAWADALAIVYADVVRSSHVAMAFWSTVAVFVALLGVVFADYISPYAKIVMLYLEALIVFLAVRNFLMPLEYRDWTGRMIEYRVIAELLRHQVFLRSLGAANRLTVSRSRVRNESGGWVIWYVESTVRELGIPTGILSVNHCRQVLALFSRREIEPQVEYNAAVAARYSMLDERLEFVARHELTVGPVLFGGASAIAILYALEMAQLRLFSPGHWVVDFVEGADRPLCHRRRIAGECGQQPSQPARIFCDREASRTHAHGTRGDQGNNRGGLPEAWVSAPASLVRRGHTLRQPGHGCRLGRVVDNLSAQDCRIALTPHPFSLYLAREVIRRRNPLVDRAAAVVLRLCLCCASAPLAGVAGTHYCTPASGISVRSA